MPLEAKVEERHQLDAWMGAVRVNAIAHDYLCNLYRSRSRWLAVVAVTLNAVVTSAIFSSTGSTDSSPLQFVAGILSMLVSVVTGLKAALGYEQRFEQHRAAAVRFSKLWTRFEDMHQLRHVPYAQRTQVAVERTKEWNDWFKDYVDAMESAPIIDTATWERVKNGRRWEYPWLCRKLHEYCCCCFPHTVPVNDRRLPPGWTEYFDEANQLPYYHKKDLDMVTWIRPKNEDMPPSPPLDSPPQHIWRASAECIAKDNVTSKQMPAQLSMAEKAECGRRVTEGEESD